MTCIAATSSRGVCWIAGDSLLTDEDNPVMRTTEAKVWSPRPGVCVGGCGDWGWLQHLRALDWPAAIEDVPGRLFTAAEGAAIVGWGARLYFLNSDRELVEYSEKIAAVGTGALVAIGALAASQACGERRVKEAVKIAAHYCPGEVGGRIVVART